MRDAYMGNLKAKYYYHGYGSFVVEESRNVHTASMSLVNGKYTMRINPDFIRKYNLGRDEQRFVFLHELMHKRGGDLHRYFGHHLSETDRQVANIVLDIFINSTLLDKEFRERINLFDKMYDRYRFPSFLLYPPAYRDEAYEYGLAESLERQGFSKPDTEALLGLYKSMWKREISITSAYYALKRFLPESYKFYVLLIGESDGNVSYGRNRDAMWGNAEGKDDTVLLPDISIAMKKWSDIYTAIKSSIISGSRDRMTVDSREVQQGPMFTGRRRDIFLRCAGMDTLLYRNEEPAVSVKGIKVNIFVDVSGSFNHIYPFVAGLLASMRDMTISSIYQFDTGVKEVTFNDMAKGMMRMGGGTNIEPVIRQILDRKMQKAVIITDGYFGGIDLMYIKLLKKQGVEIYTVLINDNPETHKCPLEHISAKTWKIRHA